MSKKKVERIRSLIVVVMMSVLEDSCIRGLCFVSFLAGAHDLFIAAILNLLGIVS